MANKILLLCLVFLCLTADFVQCKRWFSSRSRSRSKHTSTHLTPSTRWRSSSSNTHRGHKYPPPIPTSFGSSATSWGSGSKYPSPTSGLSGSGPSFSELAVKYPSSSSGLSGSGATSSGSGSIYPLSLSGLSGFDAASLGSGSKYPASLTGLSGSSGTYLGTGSKYPLSPTGLSGLDGSSSGSVSKYPSSLSGLSGSGAITSGSVSKYPPSPTGLSGSDTSSSGSGSKYPSSLSGLSGSGITSGSENKYPISSSGLSGAGVGASVSGNNKHSPPLHATTGTSFDVNLGSLSKYPPSSTGLSGSDASSSGPASKYPLSLSGLSGSGTMTSGSGSKYPTSSSGLSGAGAGAPISGTNKHSPSLLANPGSFSAVHSHTFPTNGLYGTENQHSHTQPSGGYGINSNKNNNNPLYETVHRPHNNINSNRGYDSGSYNQGSPGIHRNPSTYYSSPQYVYITEYRNSGSRYSDILTGLALYNLGRSYNHHHDHYYYDDFHRKRYNPSGSSYSNDQGKNQAVCTLRIKENKKVEILKIPCEIVSTFTDYNTTTGMPEPQNSTVCLTNATVVNNTLPSTLTNTSSVKPTMTNVTITNTTSCTPVVNATDPLSLKGPPVNTTNNMECYVHITTKETRLLKRVDCKTLIEYSKMPEPKKDTILLPSKSLLKSWISNPPWWMSIFIAV